MWAHRFFALAAAALLLASCGGKSVYDEGGGEAGSGSEPCDFTQCGSECVDLETNPRHCGECFDRCDADERCTRGRCVGGGIECMPPTTWCGSECVDLRFSQDNCGACGNACGFGSTCQNGSCIAQCPNGQCGGVCVDFASDPNNCGSCGRACDPDAYCVDGNCFCSGVNCGNDCVVDFSSNPLHCGDCFVECLGDEAACINGYCQNICPPNTLNCDGACVDWRFDPANCGGCGSVCPDDGECINGNCIPVCPMGETLCNGECFNLSISPNHCGRCNAPCPMGVSCINGACAGGGGMCGDRVVQPPEEGDPPPGPLMSVPLDPGTCRYDFSRINQWYCNGTCGNWGGPDECDQLDANAFCKLKMDNPRSTAVSFSTARAMPAPGVCCPPPSYPPGSLGCTPVGVLSSRGVNLAVSVHATNLFSTHQGGTVITNLVCTDP